MAEKSITYHDGSVYEGGVNEEGLPHGHGIYKWVNGDVYEGEWKHGQRHGHGVCSFSSGNKYDGQWKTNMKCGQGAFSWATGKGALITSTPTPRHDLVLSVFIHLIISVTQT